MNPNQPISMIEPSHVAAQGAPGNYRQPGKIAKNKTLIIVIAASVIFLVVLAVVLMVLRGNQSGMAYGVDYKKTYLCAVDQYEYLTDNLELSIQIKDDNTYRLGLLDDEYSTGSWRQTDLTRANSEDGANEVNYHLILRHEKDFIGDVETTEEAGYESEYIFSFNEKSEVVVVTDKDSESVFYCNVEK